MCSRPPATTATTPRLDGREGSTIANTTTTSSSSSSSSSSRPTVLREIVQGGSHARQPTQHCIQASPPYTSSCTDILPRAQVREVPPGGLGLAGEEHGVHAPGFRGHHCEGPGNGLTGAVNIHVHRDKVHGLSSQKLKEGHLRAPAKVGSQGRDEYKGVGLREAGRHDGMRGGGGYTQGGGEWVVGL